MAAIFRHAGVVAGIPKPALSRAGFALGRFLYLWDAVKDYQDDQKRGCFNALIAVYGESWPRGSVRTRLERNLTRFGRALDCLDLGKNADVARALLQSMDSRLRCELREAPARPVIRLSDAGHQAAFCEVCDCCCAAGEGADCCCYTTECCIWGPDIMRCCCPDQCCCWSGDRPAQKQKRSDNIHVVKRP